MIDRRIVVRTRRTPRLLSLVVILLCAGSSSAPLAAQIDPSGRWQTLSTAHFRIHYPRADSAIARRAGDEAERAWLLLVTELHPPRGPVDVVLSGAADYSNGSATPFPSNRIVVHLPPATTTPGLQAYDDWLRLVLTHELTHIFHLDRVRGPWRLGQYVFGRVPGSFPNGYQPSWVTEGLASYYESRFTSAGRTRGSFHTQILAASAVGNRWPRPNDATLLSRRWPAGYAPYAFGNRFWAEVERQQGDSAVPRFIERTSGQWIPTRVAHPLRRSAGVERDSIWARLRTAALEVAGTTTAVAGPGGTGDGTPEEAQAAARTGAEVLADSLRVAPAPVVSPSGRVAYVAVYHDRPQAIVIRETDGRESRYLANVFVDVAWVGDTLYATQIEFTNPVTLRSDLYRLDGDTWSRVTRGARLTDIAGGRDGIVAVQIVGTTNRLVRVRNGVIEPLVEARDDVQWARPDVGPDGTIAAIRRTPSEFALVTLTPGGEPVARVVTRQSQLADPAWLVSAGQRLLVTDDRTGLPQLYLVRADGEDPVQLTAEAAGATQPAASADGWVYYAALTGEGYQLRRARLDRLGGATGPDRLVERPPFEPAPPAASRVTGYRPWGALYPRYWFPYLIDGGPTYGWGGGAFTSGSDPIGRTSYSARLGLYLRDVRAEGAFYLRHQRWASHTVDLSLLQSWGSGLFGPAAGADRLVEIRKREASVGFSTVFRRWWSIATVRVAADYQIDQYPEDRDLRLSEPQRVSASIFLTAGRVLASPLGISGEKGVTASVRYRHRWRLDRDGEADEYRARLAAYLPIDGFGLFARPVLATRVAGALSTGTARDEFGIGGVPSVQAPGMPGVVFGSVRQFPVRGYANDELSGSRVVVGSVEARMPLALVARQLGDLPIGLDRLSLSAFGDYGRSWDAFVSQNEGTLASTGLELVWDLGLVYDYTFRMRTSFAVPLRAGRVTRSGALQVGVGFGAEF